MYTRKTIKKLQNSANEINDHWNRNTTSNLNENYSTCNDPDLFQFNQDNVNDVWNVDSVGVSKLRTPSNLCKSNRQVPIIRKLTPKVKTKTNKGFECNVIVEQQNKTKTKIAQLSVIKQNDNVNSNDDRTNNDDDADDEDNLILHSNSTADVSCLSSTLRNDSNLIVCDDRIDASECLVKNAENRIVFVEEGCLNDDNRYHKKHFQSIYSAHEFGERTLRKGLNSDGFVKDYYRCQYKRISPQSNRRFINGSASSSLILLGNNRQYSGIYVSLFDQHTY